MNLFTMAHQVSQLEQVIRKLNFSMQHASSDTINVIRKHRDVLENVYESIMSSEVSSNINLSHYIQRTQTCIRDCVGAAIANKPNSITKPPLLSNYTLPDYKKVNLIFYIDSTESMRSDLSANGPVSKAIQSMLSQIFWEIEMCQSTGLGYVDCISSLVWFGDATEGGDRAVPFIIDTAKEPISSLSMKLAAVKHISGGQSLPESGLHAINKTITSLREVNYETRVIYISDAPSKNIEHGASASIIKALFSSGNVRSFGLYPIEAKPDIRALFTFYKDFNKSPYSLVDWVTKFFRV